MLENVIHFTNFITEPQNIRLKQVLHLFNFIYMRWLRKIENVLQIFLKTHLAKFTNEAQCILSLFVLVYFIFKLRHWWSQSMRLLKKNIFICNDIYRDKQVNIKHIQHKHLTKHAFQMKQKLLLAFIYYWLSYEVENVERL